MSRQSSRLARWWQRNGLHLPHPGLPGVVHQTWGWYDGLPSFFAALVTLASILFLVASALYVVSANAVWQVATAPPPPTLAPGVARTSTPIPTAAPTPLPTLRTGTGRTAIVVSRTGLRLRERPSTNATPLRDLVIGTPVEIMQGTTVAEGFRWVEVRIPDGTVGWVVDDGIE